MQWKALLNSSFRHLSFIQAALNLPAFFYLFHTTCKTASLITSLKSIMIYFPMFLLRFTLRELKHLGKLRKSVSSVCLRPLQSSSWVQFQFPVPGVVGETVTEVLI